MRTALRAAATTALTVLGCAAALTLSGCTASSGASARPTASIPMTSVAVSSVPAASTPDASTTTASAPATPASSTGIDVRTADPAEYHVGSLEPSSPPTRDADQISFQTPSRNIRCTEIGSDEITCELDRHTFLAAPRPTPCTHNWLGSDVRLLDSGASLGVCAGDPQVMQNSTVLPYGYRLTDGRIACTSNSAALTCSLLGTQHGFTLNESAATLR